mmetsp:Transcript_121038/g.353710  ORF Transcript_121038/g.353710 Transcript_121038/m.353710 type:complete len:390 (-) Transcript_121038:1152-2321(-)
MPGTVDHGAEHQSRSPRHPRGDPEVHRPANAGDRLDPAGVLAPPGERGLPAPGDGRQDRSVPERLRPAPQRHDPPLHGQRRGGPLPGGRRLRGVPQPAPQPRRGLPRDPHAQQRPGARAEQPAGGPAPGGRRAGGALLLPHDGGRQGGGPRGQRALAAHPEPAAAHRAAHAGRHGRGRRAALHQEDRGGAPGPPLELGEDAARVPPLGAGDDLLAAAAVRAAAGQPAPHPGAGEADAAVCLHRLQRHLREREAAPAGPRAPAHPALRLDHGVAGAHAPLHSRRHRRGGGGPQAGRRLPDRPGAARHAARERTQLREGEASGHQRDPRQAHHGHEADPCSPGVGQGRQCRHAHQHSFLALDTADLGAAPGGSQGRRKELQVAQAFHALCT